MNKIIYTSHIWHTLYRIFREAHCGIAMANARQLKDYTNTNRTQVTSLLYSSVIAHEVHMSYDNISLNQFRGFFVCGCKLFRIWKYFSAGYVYSYRCLLTITIAYTLFVLLGAIWWTWEIKLEFVLELGLNVVDNKNYGGKYSIARSTALDCMVWQ